MRRRWAYGLIRRCPTPAPSYGSAEWLALADDDPGKVAGCVVAAECWAQAGDTLEDDLRYEVEAARLAYKRAEDADYRARAAEHRARYGSVAQVVSLADRQRRASLPRQGDHPGGPVRWNGGPS